MLQFFVGRFQATIVQAQKQSRGRNRRALIAVDKALILRYRLY
jgi:hypothetical protein